MKVSVYRNIHNGKFSIRSCEGPTKGRVIAHAHDVALVNVVFHVGKEGQHMVRKTGNKNVHAFVTGELVGHTGKGFRAGLDMWPEEGKGWTLDARYIALGARERGEPFTYNPYKHDAFVSKMDGRIICNAFRAVLSTTRGNHAEVSYSMATPVDRQRALERAEINGS